MEAHTYQVDVHWVAGRIGEASSPELLNVVDVATPPQFPNGVEGVWSPEHFFTAAVNSCFMTTFLAIADNSQLKFSTFDCQAMGKLEKVDGALMMSEIALRPKLTILDEEDEAKALRILERAERACLISNSIRSRVILEPEVQVAVKQLQEI